MSRFTPQWRNIGTRGQPKADSQQGWTCRFAVVPGLVPIAYANAAQNRLHGGDPAGAALRASRTRLWLWITGAVWAALWITEIIVAIVQANSGYSG